MDSNQYFTIALLDTGVLPNYVDMRRVLTEVVLFPDLTQPKEALKMHGTAMANTILAMAPEATLLPIVLTDEFGQLTTPALETALQWIWDHAQAFNIKIVCAAIADFSNYALDLKYLGSETQRWIARLRKNGIVVVAPAGNWYQAFEPPAQGMGWPAILKEVVSVGALSEGNDGEVIADYSQRLIPTNDATCRTTVFTEPMEPGATSGATAVVTGLLAKLYMDSPALSVLELIDKLLGLCRQRVVEEGVLFALHPKE